MYKRKRSINYREYVIRKMRVYAFALLVNVTQTRNLSSPRRWTKSGKHDVCYHCKPIFSLVKKIFMLTFTEEAKLSQMGSSFSRLQLFVLVGHMRCLPHLLLNVSHPRNLIFAQTRPKSSKRDVCYPCKPIFPWCKCIYWKGKLPNSPAGNLSTQAIMQSMAHD